MKHGRADYDEAIVDLRADSPSGSRGKPIPADEPVFLLRAQDVFAADAVRHYADTLARFGVDYEAAERVRDQADQMEAWPRRKVPDYTPPEAGRARRHEDDVLMDLEQQVVSMNPGERIDLQGSFATFWPNPPYPLPDDHLSPSERAQRWCNGRGCMITESHDPPKLVIEKMYTVWEEGDGRVATSRVPAAVNVEVDEDRPD